MINRITLLLFISLSFSSNQQIFYINHLVEKKGVLVRPITNEVVIGDIYRYFKKGSSWARSFRRPRIKSEKRRRNITD